MNNKLLGIIGFPLSHSSSPKLFQQKFERESISGYEYRLFPLSQIEDFPELLVQHPNLIGLSVTIPYKKAVFPFLTEIDRTVLAVGAVNTIKITNGQRIGYNTDVLGFEQSLKPLLLPCHRRALVLGSGGAAAAVMYVLKKLGIDYTLVSSSGKGNISYEQVTPEAIHSHLLIINTTPLGMQPNTEACPALPYTAIGSEHLLYDLIYNPEETTFLQMGKAQGAAIKNGRQMLEIQAEEAWKIWTS